LEGDNGFFEWANGLYYCEHTYNLLLNQGQKPEQARSILPNSLKTELVMTANLREWRHIFDLRTSRSAHPQAREISNMIYDEFIKLGLGVFFEGIAPFRG
jgi:thymidylate synthase (FAD)